MRKRTKLLYDRMKLAEDRLDACSARLRVLECDHSCTVLVEDKDPAFGECGEWGGRYVSSYMEKCSKCGKVLRNLTEKEYLVMRLERDEQSFLGTSEKIKKRLADLEEEESA